MSLLHNLFSGKAPAKDSVGQLAKKIESDWSEYLTTVPQKRTLLEAGHPTSRLYGLINTAIFDVEETNTLIDEEAREAHIQEHARHIHSLDRLQTALRDFDTRHEYARGVLAHLHAVLAAQMHLLQLYKTQELDITGFRNAFLAQLDYEEQLVATIQESLTTLPTLVAELLTGTASEPHHDIETKELYPLMRQQLYKYFTEGYNEGQAHADADLVVQLLKTLTQETYDQTDPQTWDEEHGWRQHDFDVYLLNRPDFALRVKALFEAAHHTAVSDSYVQAFLRAFREGFHELARQYTHPK